MDKTKNRVVAVRLESVPHHAVVDTSWEGVDVQWVENTAFLRSHLEFVQFHKGLKHVNFTHCVFNHCTFILNNIRHTMLHQCQANYYENRRWKEHSLSFGLANIEGLAIVESALPGMNMSNTRIRGLNVQRSQLPGIELYGAKIQKANIADSILDQAKLTEVNVANCHFSHASLRGATITTSDIANTVFTNVDFTGAYVYATNLSNVRFVNCRFGDALFNAVYMENVAFEGDFPTSFQSCFLDNVEPVELRVFMALSKMS
jgi:uncharacterized protein YjbI with pentapeptide repeats